MSRPSLTRAQPSAAEQALFELTNAERVKAGLPPLRPSFRLLVAARTHAANMAARDRLAHELDGTGVTDRVTAAGYVWARVGENIGWNARTPRDAVAVPCRRLSTTNLSAAGPCIGRSITGWTARMKAHGPDRRSRLSSHSRVEMPVAKRPPNPAVPLSEASGQRNRGMNGAPRLGDSRFLCPPCPDKGTAPGRSMCRARS